MKNKFLVDVAIEEEEYVIRLYKGKYHFTLSQKDSLELAKDILDNMVKIKGLRNETL